MPLPVAAQRLLVATQSAEYKLSEVVRIIESDPALAARIMRQVTSALFGRVRCTSIAHAVTRLGARMLQTTAIAAAAIDLFGQDEETAQTVVRHANTTAAIARFFARHCGLVAEEMYTCGLLHDIGKLMLLRGADLDYHDLLDAETAADQVHVVERERYGFDHALVAGHVLTSWKLPHPLGRVVAWHHQPHRAFRTSGPTARMVALMRLADHLAHIDRESSIDQAGGLIQRLPDEFGVLGLSEEAFGTLCPELTIELHPDGGEEETESRSRIREASSIRAPALEASIPEGQLTDTLESARDPGSPVDVVENENNIADDAAQGTNVVRNTGDHVNPVEDNAVDNARDGEGAGAGKAVDNADADAGPADAEADHADAAGPADAVGPAADASSTDPEATEADSAPPPEPANDTAEDLASVSESGDAAFGRGEASGGDAELDDAAETAIASAFSARADTSEQSEESAAAATRRATAATALSDALSTAPHSKRKSSASDATSAVHGNAATTTSPAAKQDTAPGDKNSLVGTQEAASLATAAAEHKPDGVDNWFATDKLSGKRQQSSESLLRTATRDAYAITGLTFFLGTATGRIAAIWSRSIPRFLAFALLISIAPALAYWMLSKLRKR